jgi:hypothetical protein
MNPTGGLAIGRARTLFVVVITLLGVSAAGLASVSGEAALAETNGTREIAFLSQRHGGSSVIVAGAGTLSTLARNANGPPVWFGDGRRIAYTGSDNLDTRLHVFTIGGRRRDFRGCRGKVAVAPDGRSVICEGSGEADAFNHVNLVTGTVTLLGSNDEGLGDTTPKDPAWAADGTIALLPSTDAPIFLYRLRGADADLRLGKPLRQIESPRSGSPTDPDFSPDGRWLAFATNCSFSCPGHPANTRVREIWIADVRTGNIVRRVVKRGWQPSWSPTGDELAFASDMRGDVEIYTVQTNGHNLRRMTFSRRADTEPAWRPQAR